MLDTNLKQKVGAVVLAAGKGTRLKCTDMPKVMLLLGKKPIVEYTVETLEKLGLSSEQICLVVGFFKEKVMDYFSMRVRYAVQEEQLGTAHAAYTGIVSLPKNIEYVLVMNGDDSAFYKPETFEMLIENHVKNKNTLTLLTAEIENPGSIGRVIRRESGEVEIIEKENITEEQKKLKEISTNTFIFDRAWYEEMFPHMPIIPKLNEYGLPTTLKMAKNEQKKYEVIALKDTAEWFGVNTPEELEEARKRKQLQ